MKFNYLKTGLTFVALVLFSINLSAKTVITSKHGGGTEGYKYVSPTHNTSNGQDHHELACDDPGQKTCEWDTDPWESAKLVIVEDQVQDEITNGNLAGTATIEGANVDWTSTDINNYVFTIVINEL